MLASPRILSAANDCAYSSGLKQACPTGVFVTLTPGEPTLWSAVLFIRDGMLNRLLILSQIGTDMLM